MMGKAKAHREQGQAALGWAGLAALAAGGGCSWLCWPALLPLPLSAHRTCPHAELWGLNELFCSEALTTPLLPGRLSQPEPALSISTAGAVLRQLKIGVTQANRNTREKWGNLGGAKPPELRCLKLKAPERHPWTDRLWGACRVHLIATEIQIYKGFSFLGQSVSP